MPMTWGFLGALVCRAAWRYAAFAQWLTREDEERAASEGLQERCALPAVV